MQGCRIRHLPQRLNEKDISLSLPGLPEIFRTCRVLREMDSRICSKLGIRRPLGVFGSVFLVLRMFKWLYIIKKDGTSRGIIGAYSWEPGESAVLTMVIWNRKERGRGTGTMAVNLIVRELTERELCRDFFVEVKDTNERGLRFWKRAGFLEIDRMEGTVIMHLSGRQAIRQ